MDGQAHKFDAQGRATMKPISIAAILLVFLSGCTSRDIMLKNRSTGQVEKCGGTPIGVGEHNSDEDRACVAKWEKQGFVRYQPPYCLSLGYCFGEGFGPDQPQGIFGSSKTQ